MSALHSNTMSKCKHLDTSHGNTLCKCIGCHKVFSTDHSLMKHIGQTNCSQMHNQQFLNHLNKHLSQSKLVSSFVSQQQDDLSRDCPQWNLMMGATHLMKEAWFWTLQCLVATPSHTTAGAPIDHIKSQTPHSIAMQVETDLLQIVNNISAPLEAFQRIMEWARSAHVWGHKFSPSRKTHQSQMTHLQETTLQISISPIQSF